MCVHLCSGSSSAADVSGVRWTSVNIRKGWEQCVEILHKLMLLLIASLFSSFFSSLSRHWWMPGKQWRLWSLLPEHSGLLWMQLPERPQTANWWADMPRSVTDSCQSSVPQSDPECHPLTAKRCVKYKLYIHFIQHFKLLSESPYALALNFSTTDLSYSCA